MKTLIPEQIQAYINDVVDKPNSAQQQLIDHTKSLREANMMTGHDQGVFLAMLVRMMGANKILEIGTFTGYSALMMASAMPETGQLIACDMSNKWSRTAQEHWEKANVAHKIDLQIGLAQQAVQKLLDNNHHGSFDMVYIDADKKAYHEYYEASLELLRPGGLICIDNMIWYGQAAQENPDNDYAKTIRQLALDIGKDTRVSSCLLPIQDGLLLAYKL